MSKPVLKVLIETARKEKLELPALFDTGSFYTIIRQDLLPAGTPIVEYAESETFRTAGQTGHVTVLGETSIIVQVGDKRIRVSPLVSPDLGRELLIGAGAMQMWDVSIKNRNGKTKVIMGRDMRDPEITEVD